MNRRELATVLAALRCYQERGYGDMCKLPPRLADIAVDGATNLTPLDDNEIDALCERLNCEGDEQPEDEPDELLVWHRYELITVNVGGALYGLASTNDNEDRGYPGNYAEWPVEYPDRATAMLHTGGSHIGISGVKVIVTIDGEQV